MPQARKPLSERFWGKVIRMDGCWGWSGKPNDCGYAVLNAGGRGRPLVGSRVSWEIHNGPITGGLCVLHRCDNRLCTNPEHLFLGTRQDNMVDMDAKGRRRTGVVPPARQWARLYPERALAAVRKSWDVRRAKYGPSGHSPAAYSSS